MFKIKDLMIKVIPDEAARPDFPGFNAAQCGGCSLITCVCTFQTCRGCSQCSPPSGGNIFGAERINPADLPALKAQLQQRLAAVEALEQGLEPQTVKEAEMLEEKLKDALRDVQRMKQELGGKK